MKSNSVITDGAFTRLKKTLAIPWQVRAAKIDKEKRIKPQQELIKAIKSEGSPDYELVKTLAIIDKNICGEPFPLGKGYVNYGYFLLCVRNFVENFRNSDDNAQLTCFLNDGELKLVLCRGPSGELLLTLTSKEELSEEVKEELKQLGLKIGDETLITPTIELLSEAISSESNDIVGAIKSKSTKEFISFLGYVDKLITENPFGSYKKTQYEDLISRVENFIKRTQDINPYATFGFNLGDGKSKLLINVDVERGHGKAKHVLSFDIETHDLKVKQRFGELKEANSLFLDQVLN